MKKITTLMLSLITVGVFIALITLTGCEDGSDGKDGMAGKTGISSLVGPTFKGTEEEAVLKIKDDLKGDQGDKGDQGGKGEDGTPADNDHTDEFDPNDLCKDYTAKPNWDSALGVCKA